MFDLNIKAKLQDAVNALNYGSLSVPDKKRRRNLLLPDKADEKPENHCYQLQRL
ncbi:hypothetical protein [Methanosarcina barkeri]|uniref:hypothetical protein n=1 Tax=Methanosarcina barkeri TaxID=2208 RepID=UPI000A44E3E8|nr:hypothetical protein [Methanosarcina barkeri]